ncbi:MAG: hypothetical protein OER90_11135 [Gemmatimonadota bacterium]|nr:hypothetical protein [Gemmatimonadota bacterium]
MWAASIFVLVTPVGCGDLVIDNDVTLSTSELLILGMQPAGGSIGVGSAYVRNDRETFVRLQHSDAFRTLYAEVRFPIGAITSLNGQPIGPGDSVLVALDPEPGRYGVTLSPAGLVLGSAVPRVTFSFATYGDFSVADGSSTYPSRTAYANALTLWFETTIGRWQRVSGSSFTGTDAVAGPLREPGRYLVAAPR